VTTSETAPRPQLDLAFARRGDRTVLNRRVFRWPFALARAFRLDAAPAHMLTVIAQSSSGAVHGEDRLWQRFHVQAEAAAHVTTQGASSVHRADAGATTSETIAIQVDDGGYLEYLPEARILFPGAALDQAVDIDCAPRCVALVGDAFTIHDPGGSGQGFRRLASMTTLRVGGAEPVMIDRLDISRFGKGATAGFAAFASLTLVAPGRAEAGASLADALSQALAKVPGLYAAASPLPGDGVGLGLRLAGRDLRATRAGTRVAWGLIREAFHGAAPPSRRKSDEDGA
jgi:urease accessory protein